MEANSSRRAMAFDRLMTSRTARQANQTPSRSAAARYPGPARPATTGHGQWEQQNGGAISCQIMSVTPRSFAGSTAYPALS